MKSTGTTDGGRTDGFGGRGGANFIEVSELLADTEDRGERIGAARRPAPMRAITAAASPASSGDDVAALTLDARGMIRYCNQAVESLFKYRRSELVWRHVSLLLPQLADLELLPNGDLNPRLRFLCYIGSRFQLVAKEGQPFAGELCINVLDNSGGGRLSLIVNAAPDAAARDRAQFSP